jgi:glycosyltransferase involved in cell wall biosynthesis
MSVYNGERYLRESVESILKQTFADFEFIITDDGSRDATWDILNGYDDPRVLLMRNPKNIGLTHSLNKGLVLARGEYVARIDADDVSFPQRLEMQVDFLERHTHIGVLGTAVQFIDSSGNPAKVQRFPEQHNAIRWSLCFYNPIPHPSVMARRQLMEQASGYRPDLKTAQDYDLWQRLSSVTRLANLPDVLLYLRKHDASVTQLRLTEQCENSMGASRRMIAQILGEDVDGDVVRWLWDLEHVTPESVRQTAGLIHRLSRAATSSSRISDQEKHLIRKDAAQRLITLIQSDVRRADFWYILALACSQDPGLVGGVARNRLQRIFGAARLSSD